MEFKRWKNLGEIVPDFVESFVNLYNEKDSTLREIEEFASKEKVPILLPSSATFLALLLKMLKPKRVLEIGTGIGYSTLVILKAVEGKVISVDSNRKRVLTAEKFLKSERNRVDLVERDAFEVIREFLCRGEKFDFIFVDSTKGEYPFFNYKLQPLVEDGGCIVFDNVLFRGYLCGRSYDKRYERTVSLLKNFLAQVKEYPNFESYLIPVGDGMLVCLKKEG